jgi:hypothetical protein
MNDAERRGIVEHEVALPKFVEGLARPRADWGRLPVRSSSMRPPDTLTTPIADPFSAKGRRARSSAANSWRKYAPHQTFSSKLNLASAAA